MSEFTCPKCHAEIHADMVETTGRAECPFCAADLPALELTAHAQAGTASDNLDDTFDESGQVTQGLPPVPDKSRIKVIEANANRLVIYIPGGGKQTTGTGCFAAAWIGFMCLFTPPWVFGMFQKGNNGPPLYFIIPFLGLFWAIGLGMGFLWLKMKYERSFLLLQRDRLVLQKVLFNRKSVIETPLTPESRAELVESYQQNDVPVYRIEVQGQTRPAKFAMALSDPEKDWLVDRINEFLDVVTVPVVTSAVGETVEQPDESAGEPAPGAIADKRYERLTPATLPADSRIEIDEDSRDALQFHYPAVGHGGLRWAVATIMILFAVVWYSAVLGFVANANMLGFAIPFLIIGLMPLAIALFAARGHTTVRLTRETLACRWHVANLGRSKRVETSAIDDIRVGNSIIAVGQNPRIRSAKPGGQAAANLATCIVRAGIQSVLLTILQKDQVHWQVATLLRTRLQDMGHSLKL